MNVYDFDGTIYRGDSSIDFFLFCVKRHPMLLRYFPKQALATAAFAVKRLDRVGWKEAFFSFLNGVPDIDATVSAFWAVHIAKIQSWYLQQRSADDIIISASPEFLLRPACERLKIQPPIASVVDKKTGRFASANCRGAEKVRRLQSLYGALSIESFYSDSLSDTPLAALAKKAFYVRKTERLPWPDGLPQG